MSNTRGFSIDGTHCNDYGIVMGEGSRRPLAPPTKDRYLEIEGLIGAHYFGSDFRSLEIRVECEVDQELTADALQVRLRALAAALTGVDGKPKLVTLSFDDETAKTYDVYALKKFDVKRIVAEKVGEFRLQFICFDATAYGAEVVTEENITISPGQFTVENTGTAPDYPVIEITNNGEDPVEELTITVETEV